MSSTLTGVYPWARHAISERLSAWGVAGYGEGALTLTPAGPDGGNGPAIRSDLELAMAAAGVRGVLLAAPADGGPEVAVKADALGVRTTSATAPDLAAADADVTRLRLGVEGAWAVRLENGGTLTPTLEIGVRHDGGDAETGAGADLGGGLAWSGPGKGVICGDPGPGPPGPRGGRLPRAGPVGVALLRPDAGHRTRARPHPQPDHRAWRRAGGMDALLGRGTMADLVGAAHGDDLASRRLELRLGYGLAASGGFASTPEAALARADGHREYSLGWRLTLAGRGAGALELRLEATRREPAHDRWAGSGCRPRARRGGAGGGPLVSAGAAAGCTGVDAGAGGGVGAWRPMACGTVSGSSNEPVTARSRQAATRRGGYPGNGCCANRRAPRSAASCGAAATHAGTRPGGLRVTR